LLLAASGEGLEVTDKRRDSGFSGTYFSGVPKTLSEIYLLETSLFEVFLGAFTLWFVSLRFIFWGISLREFSLPEKFSYLFFRCLCNT